VLEYDLRPFASLPCCLLHSVALHDSAVVEQPSACVVPKIDAFLSHQCSTTFATLPDVGGEGAGGATSRSCFATLCIRLSMTRRRHNFAQHAASQWHPAQRIEIGGLLTLIDRNLVNATAERAPSRIHSSSQPASLQPSILRRLLSLAAGPANLRLSNVVPGCCGTLGFKPPVSPSVRPNCAKTEPSQPIERGQRRPIWTDEASSMVLVR
jgi:hypothetical protein